MTRPIVITGPPVALGLTKLDSGAVGSEHHHLTHWLTSDVPSRKSLSNRRRDVSLEHYANRDVNGSLESAVRQDDPRRLGDVIVTLRFELGSAFEIKVLPSHVVETQLQGIVFADGSFTTDYGRVAAHLNLPAQLGDFVNRELFPGSGIVRRVGSHRGFAVHVENLKASGRLDVTVGDVRALAGAVIARARRLDEVRTHKGTRVSFREEQRRRRRRGRARGRWTPRFFKNGED